MYIICILVSVQFSHSVMSDSLWPHARPPCPSPSPGVHSDSCPSSPWCHPAISSSVVPFSSCPQSFPASESFPMSQLFAWGGQSTGVSALASFLPKKSQGWSPSEWTGWISLQSRGFYYFNPRTNAIAICSSSQVGEVTECHLLSCSKWINYILNVLLTLCISRFPCNSKNPQ